MATKKQDTEDRRFHTPENLDERRKRKLEAVTVDGTESFPPPGMEKGDGTAVALDYDENTSLEEQQAGKGA